MMKRLGMILMIGLATLLPVTALELQLSSQTAAVGEVLTLTLTDGSGVPQLLDYPSLNLGRWVRNQTRQSTRIINGQASYGSSYSIVLTEPGELVIPELEVRVGGQTLRTRPQTVKVVPAAALEVPAGQGKLSLDQALFGQIRIPDDRRTFYLGEEIPLELTLYIAPGVEVRQLSYPELTVPGAVFADYSRLNPENRQYQPPQQGRTEIDGRLYQTIVFRTSFRELAPGPVTINAETRVGIPEPETKRRNRVRDPFDDEFFSSFFGRSRPLLPYPVRFEPPAELEIKPLPPPPPGVRYLGLVGDWKLDARLDTAEARAGEPLSLDLVVSGPGSGETLSAPKLELPNFRIYPPEVKQLGEGAETAWSIRYVVIPLKDGAQKLKLKLAVFDPARAEYRIRDLDYAFEVRPGNRAAAVVAGAREPESATAETTGAEPASELNYLKSAPAGPVPLPLGAKRRALWFALLLLGPLGAGAIVLFRRRRERRRNDPASRRRRAALSRKAAVLQAIRETDDLAAVVNTEVAALLADSRNLPPGATAQEVADALNDAELSPLLRRYGSAAYAPPGALGADADARTRLHRAVKRLVVSLAVLFSALTVTASPTPFEEAAAAYDRGDFAAAAECYRNLLNPRTPDPAILYNLGCAEYRAGQLVEALRDFEEAHLLAPGDRATLENLNVVRRRLLLPPLGEVDSPEGLLKMLRGQLRPDHWLELAALFWFLSWLGAAAWPRFRIWTISCGAVLILLCGIAGVTLRTGPYHPDRLLVTADPAELRTRPAANSGRVETALPRGTEAWLLERRPEWWLIRGAGREGWVRPAEVAPILTP